MVIQELAGGTEKPLHSNANTLVNVLQFPKNYTSSSLIPQLRSQVWWKFYPSKLEFYVHRNTVRMTFQKQTVVAEREGLASGAQQLWSVAGPFCREYHGRCTSWHIHQNVQKAQPQN